MPRYYGGGGCAANYAFQGGPEAPAFLASYVIFGLFTFAIWIGSLVVRRRNHAAKSIFGLPFDASMLFLVLGYLLQLISLCLQECGNIGIVEYYRLMITITICQRLSEVLLLYVMLVNLIPYLRDQLGESTKLLKISYGVVVGIVFLLMVPILGLTGYIYTKMYESYYGDVTQSILDAQTDVIAAYDIVYLAVVILGSLHLVFLNTQGKRQGIHFTFWIPLFCFFMIVWTVLDVVIIVRYGLQYHYDGEIADIVFSYMFDLFLDLSYLALVIIGARAIPKHQNFIATYGAPGYSQPMHEQPAIVR